LSRRSATVLQDCNNGLSANITIIIHPTLLFKICIYYYHPIYAQFKLFFHFFLPISQTHSSLLPCVRPRHSSVGQSPVSSRRSELDSCSDRVGFVVDAIKSLQVTSSLNNIPNIHACYMLRTYLII